MKITIELSEAQVKRIKAYLKEVSPDINPNITKENTIQEMPRIVDGNIHFGAMGECVTKKELKSSLGRKNLGRAQEDDTSF